MLVTELKHFGILGMHWGRRKARASGESSSSNSSATADSSDDHRQVSELRKKKPSQLSNKEMQAVITRAQLEKQFADLNKPQTSAGKKFVTELLLNASKTVATDYVNANAKKGSALLIKKFSM